MDGGNLFKDEEVAMQPSLILTNDRENVARDATELQKLLIDERMRCESHKTNYQLLKEQHTKLQNELVKCEEELTDVHRSKKLLLNEQENKNNIIQKLERKLELKLQELEVTKTQIVNPNKLEAIKGEISKELEGPIKDYMITMDKEVEKYRTEYNKIRHEFTMLQANADHIKKKQVRDIEEQRMRHQAELSTLEYERDGLKKKLQEVACSTDDNDNQLLQLKKMKTHLEQRVCILQEEVDEERKLRENKNRDMSSLQQSYFQDTAKIEANLKAVEMECKSLESQCDRYKQELQASNEKIFILSQDLQQANKQSAFLREELDESLHRIKLTEGEHKMSLLKVTGKLKRENDSICAKNNDLETKLELQKNAVEELEKELEKVEKINKTKIQKEIKIEWEKNNTLSNEKSNLEQHILDLKQRLQDDKNHNNEKLEKLNEEVHNKECALNSTLKDYNILKDKFQDLETECCNVTRQMQDNEHLKHQLAEKECLINDACKHQKVVQDECDKYKQQLKVVRNEIELMRKKADDEIYQVKTSLQKNKENFVCEKQKIQNSLKELKYVLKKVNCEKEKTKINYKKLKMNCFKKIQSLCNENEILKAEQEKLQIQIKAGKHGVSMEEHNRVRSELRDMKRKMSQFQRCFSEEQENISFLSPTQYNNNFRKSFNSSSHANL